MHIPTANYSEKFLGGRGLAAKLYWDLVAPDVKALGPENCLVFVNGPFAGFYGIAGSRYQICGKSPESEPEAFSYCNLGGKWGLSLKFAGYDALVVKGKAEKPVYLFIHDGNIEIRDASFIWVNLPLTLSMVLKNSWARRSVYLPLVRPVRIW